MNFSEIFNKNITCDNIKGNKTRLHSLSRKHNFRKTTEGDKIDPQSF